MNEPISEQQRVMLAIGLCLAIFIGWQVFFPSKPHPKPANETTTAEQAAAPTAGEAGAKDITAAPTTRSGDDAAAPSPGGAAAKPDAEGKSPTADDAAGEGAETSPETRVAFETPLFSGELTNHGPALTRLELANYKERPAEKAEGVDEEPPPPGPMSLVFADRAGAPYQAGIAWHLGADASPPPLTFVPGGDETHTLTGTTATGLAATIAITPRLDAYGIDYVLTIDNQSGAPAAVGAAIELAMRHVEQEGGLFSGRRGQASGMCSIAGAVERKAKKDLDDGPYEPTAPAGWAGLDKQYFVVAAVADNTVTTRCRIEMRDDNIVVNYDLGEETLVAGAKWQRKLSLYVGPKRDEDLEAISPGLVQVINYSIMKIPLGFIARPMIFLLKLFHGWVNSWGLAILLLTLSVKLVLFPVTYKSQVSMRKMQMLKPQLDKIKEQYPKDRERQQQAQFALYKESGVNPLGGCLPMLLQMPVWFALYRSLWSAVDLYMQPFLWLPDLTAKEPGAPFLAVSLGVVFFVQQLLTPMAADNSQAKLMKWVMPIMFTVFMFALPSALVLYIFINSVLSILQQLAINRSIGPSPAVAAAKAAKLAKAATSNDKSNDKSVAKKGGGQQHKRRRVANAPGGFAERKAKP